MPEERRGMAGPLPGERIEEDDGNHHAEKAGGDSVQIAPASPRCAA